MEKHYNLFNLIPFKVLSLCLFHSSEHFVLSFQLYQVFIPCGMSGTWGITKVRMGDIRRLRVEKELYIFCVKSRANNKCNTHSTLRQTSGLFLKTLVDLVDGIHHEQLPGNKKPVKMSPTFTPG